MTPELVELTEEYVEFGPEGGGGATLFHPPSLHGQAAQSSRSSPVLADAGFDQKLLTGPNTKAKTSKPTHNFLIILPSPHNGGKF